MTGLCTRLACVAVAAMITAAAPALAQTVVTFDDLTGSGILADGYGGINWGGQWGYYDSSQPPYNPESGSERIYDQAQTADTIFSFATPTVFDGAYVAGYSFADVTFNLYDGATLVDSVSITPSATPAYLATNYTGLVTEVDVYDPDVDYYVLDNITYGSGSTVPEPGALATFGAGIAALGLARRRRA